jgi:hypothetical protein
VLAQTLEAEGFSTILVTMMPFWVERVGAPRALAVEFPFGQTLGQPHNQEQQMRVIRQALAVLESADQPGVIKHSAEVWLEPQKEAMAAWQPAEASPIISEMTPHLLKLLRERKRGQS